jgi:hypothetical protein
LIHVHGGTDLTLEEINRVGELVTESMDDDANCIWGARVSEDMKGKLTVMTIITGVKSPWLLGKMDKKQAHKRPIEQARGHGQRVLGGVDHQIDDPHRTARVGRARDHVADHVAGAHRHHARVTEALNHRHVKERRQGGFL